MYSMMILPFLGWKNICIFIWIREPKF